VRRLIVNADDFGLTAGVNRAILECHQHGIVTSATLMANSVAFDAAVALTRRTPTLSIGCHLVLADGVPLLAASQVPTLLDRGNGARPEFRQSWSRFAWAALRHRIAPHEIEAEAAAQIRKLESAGIAVTHLDTHKHTHLFPDVLHPVLRAAKACGVRALRNPFGPVHFALLTQSPRLWKRWLATSTLRRWATRFRGAVEAAGMVTTDGTLGIVATGAMNEPLLAWMLERIPDGTWELVCHPGYNDEQLQRVRTRLRDSREQELHLLTSTRTRELLLRQGIRLISFQDLARDFAPSSK